MEKKIECVVWCEMWKVKSSKLKNLENHHSRLTHLVVFDSNPISLPCLSSKKVYHEMRDASVEETEMNLYEEADALMSNDIVDASFKTKQALIERQSSGWLFRQEKTDKVGQFNADVYKVSNMTFLQKKRREHLSDRDIQRNKQFKESISRLNIPPSSPQQNDGDVPGDFDFEERSSLLPPQRCTLAWSEYAALPTDHTIGRKKKEKQTQKVFEASLSMSRDFPVKLEELLDVLEMLGPKAKFYKRIRDFVDCRMPPGFPVRINIPIVPAVKGTVSFLEFEFCDDGLDEALFEIPDSYRDEPNWFKKTK